MLLCPTNNGIWFQPEFMPARKEQNDFGKLLAALRDEKGWDQDELGIAAGFSQAAISKWERGERKPKDDSIIALAKALIPEDLDSNQAQQKYQSIMQSLLKALSPNITGEIEYISNPDVQRFVESYGGVIANADAEDRDFLENVVQTIQKKQQYKSAAQLEAERSRKISIGKRTQ